MGLTPDRFTSAQEFAKALTDPAFRHGAEAVAGVTGGGGSWKSLTALMSVTTVLLALALGWTLARPLERVPRVVRSYLELPPNAELPRNTHLALSTDGSSVVVSGFVDGQRMLLSHQLSETDFAPMPGTEFGTGPSFSPDGRSIVFGKGGADPRIIKFSVDNETMVELAAGRTFGETFSASDGMTYFWFFTCFRPHS